MKVKIYLKIFVFNFLLISIYSIWKETKEYKYEDLSILTSDFSFNNFSLNNKLDYSDFESEIFYKTIEIGQVKTEFLYNEEIYIFNLSEYKTKNDIVITFYPLDCHIKIIGENNIGSIKIESISNYKYDSFYAIIGPEELNSTIFKIKTLISTYDDFNIKRTFHLIINSFENSNADLNITDNEPILLNFDNTLDSINLKYKLNRKQDYPILVSFFIKERVKFLITVSNGNNNFKKTIAYTDKILIKNNFKPKESKDPYDIIITIEKIEKGKNAIMTVKIKEDYSKPIYLQQNSLNLAFIPNKATYQFYYMELFEGEIVEIFLNNKKYKGILISKIIQKEKAEECNIFEDSKCYPKEDDFRDESYLIYDEYSQRISFQSFNSNGCYLLISYYSVYLNEANNISYILGTDFTLLSKVLNKDNFKPEIINIPLNEYIFGIMDYSYVNIHYYSLFIPEDLEISIEFSGTNIIYFAKEGIKSFQPIYENEPFTGFNELIYDLSPQKINMESFGGKYITFAFIKYSILEISNYYFRILQRNKTNNYFIYPLDTNKANLCHTTNITGEYSCFFYVDNYYSDLNDLTQFIIYGYGKDRISYKAWSVNRKENDYYSIDLKKITSQKSMNETQEFFRLCNKNDDFFIIQILSDYPEILTILTNYYDMNYFFPTINIYSYQIVYAYKKNITFDFDYRIYDKFRIFINNTAGKGDIFFNDNFNKDITEISDKNIMSFFMTNNIKRFSVGTKGNLAFSIKIDYLFENDILREIKLDNDIKSLTDQFPLGFYFKENDYKGTDINFYFHFEDLNNEENKIIIKAYIIDYEMSKNIKFKEYLELLDFGKEIDGMYDERTHNGLIVFDNEINNKYTYGKDNYYLIIIKNETLISNFSLDVHASSKDNSHFSMPFNKYVSGSINLNNQENQLQKYFIKRNDENNSSIYIIEFSTNYENLELIFNDTFIEKKEIKGGIQKYYINLNDSNYYEGNYFEIKIKNSTDKDDKNELKKANYVLKLYSIEKEKESITSDIFDISYDFISENKDKYNLKIINKKDINENITEEYDFLYILTVYEKDKIINHEIINTISLTYSEYMYSYRRENPYQEESYILNSLAPNKKYVISLFIKVHKKQNFYEAYYYSYEFNIKTNDINNNRLIVILVISFSVSFLILLIFYLFLKNSEEKIEL